MHEEQTTNDMADRIDYNKNGDLDDVVVPNVEMFRLEYMDDNTVWIKCYRTGKTDVVFWLNARGKITGRHEYDTDCPDQATNKRFKAQISLASLPTQLRVDADEMNGWGAGNEAEHARQAADEIERLRAALKSLVEIADDAGDVANINMMDDVIAKTRSILE